VPTEPGIIDRAEQPYVAIKELVTMEDIGRVLPPLIPEVFDWLSARGIAPAGAPFWKYNLIDMERSLEVEVGVPTAVLVPGDERVLAGVLPAGRYATVVHIGHPSELINVTGELLAWADKEGLAWDVTETEHGQRWAARLESYLTDPAEEPDMGKWETELAFRLAR
jgi:effector-binding domain-containing protein